VFQSLSGRQRHDEHKSCWTENKTVRLSDGKQKSHLQTDEETKLSRQKKEIEHGGKILKNKAP